MKRKMYLSVVLFLAVVALTAAIHTNGLQAADRPDVFDGDGSFSREWVQLVFPSAQRPTCKFDHDGDHMDKSGVDDCSVCHHVYKDGRLVEDESSEDQACSDCHQIRPANGTAKTLHAYHHLCKDCHHRENRGPVACGECHVKS